MLDKKRIKEAEQNVKSYLSDGLLIKKVLNEHVLKILINNGKESLRVADEVNNQKISYLWTIVCSYYSMFYYANAILLKFGYKVGDKIVHKVTSDAMIVYVKNKLEESLLEDYEDNRKEALILAGIKTDSLLESLDFERNKRSHIQYNMGEAKKYAKAQTSLKRAKIFAKEMEKIL